MEELRCLAGQPLSLSVHSLAPARISPAAQARFVRQHRSRRPILSYDSQTSLGKYRLYPLRKDPRTGKRRNLGTFPTRAAAEKHEREMEFFKRRARKVLPNMRLTLSGGDRLKGSGVLCAARTNYRSVTLRPASESPAA
jgi:hypothetical protein